MVSHYREGLILAGVGNQCMAALDAGCARASRRAGMRMNWSKDMQAMKKVSHPCLSFLPVLPLSSSSTLLSSSPSFHQLITINHGIHLRLIQTLCLYLRRSTQLGKTLTPLLITSAPSILQKQVKLFNE